MGAKTWMLVYANGSPMASFAATPVLDRGTTQAWLAELFPQERMEPTTDGSLSYTNPPDDAVFAGCFGNVAVVAASEFAIDRPSQLPENFLHAAKGRDVYLHAMHSVADWFAFAVWRGGTLQRSLSLSPDSGIMENIGKPLAFEHPYWSGEHPAIDPEDMDDDEPDYPLPFHPLELGEAALRELFGYQLEGYVDPTMFEPEAIPLMCFKRKKKSWFQR